MKKYKAVNPGVGKKMMGCLYIHRSMIEELNHEKKLMVLEAQTMISGAYDIIKIDEKNNSVTFTVSPDWDTAHEPLVGNSTTVNLSTGAVKQTKPSEKNPQIYHHKWQFVRENYPGFNVEEAKKRSEYWMNHPHVLSLKADKQERFNSKIGRKKYWDEVVCSVIG